MPGTLPTSSSRSALRDRGERGSAMVTTMMILALLTALATTVSVLTINNLQSSWRAQQAGSALNAADAGVAQAMSYLRSSGVRGLACSPTCGSTNPWGSGTSPATQDIDGEADQSYRTWIVPIRPYPANDPGRYKIHSIGRAAGDAERYVTAEVEVSATNLPRGVFARAVSGGGNASVENQSVFSTGCVHDRSKIKMHGNGVDMDLFYGIPVGVHTSQYISDHNGGNQYCSSQKRIHPPNCDPEFPYDHSRAGGNLASTGCASVQTTYPKYYAAKDFNGDGNADVHGSFIRDDASLFALFDINPQLSQEMIDRLRSVAQAQGNYWTNATGWTDPDPVNEPHSVMFFDLAATNLGGEVNLNDVDGFDPEEGSTCTPRSLVIVVEGGNVKLNSNQELAASLFLTAPAPYGQVVKANGTSEFVGTILADSVNLVGTTEIRVNECFVQNSSPALLDLRLQNYTEEDRTLD